MSLSPGTRLGPYEVLAAIGAGGERLTRFEREAQVLGSLNHPNIAGDQPSPLLVLLNWKMPR